MTPDQARKAYYDALSMEYRKAIDWAQPIVQHEADTRAWQTVIDRIRVETYLELREQQQRIAAG